VRRDARWTGRRSFYVEHGDWFVAVCAGLVGLGWLGAGPGGPRPVRVRPAGEGALGRYPLQRPEA